MTGNYIGRLGPQQIKQEFGDHVSSGKVTFFDTMGVDFIPGKREGAFMWDVSGEKRLIDCHSNGGVFNLGHRHPQLIEIMTQSMQELDIGNHVREVAPKLQNGLRNFAGHPLVGEVRGVGLIAAIEFVKDKANRTPFPGEAKIARRFYDILLEEALGWAVAADAYSLAHAIAWAEQLDVPREAFEIQMLYGSGISIGSAYAGQPS